MVDLSDTCCLDIGFDPNNNSLVFSNDVTQKKSKRILLKNLSPALLNKSLHYPEMVYEEHVQVFHIEDNGIPEKGLYFDIICIPAGLLGVEYIKSHIYFSPNDKEGGKCSTVIEVHHGNLTVIMQRNLPREEFDIHTAVEEGLIVKLSKGEKLAVPQGYFYTFINTEVDPVVFVRIHRGNGVVDYSILKKEKGLAYYCIRKNARQEIVKNPVYREVPQIRRIKPNAFLDEFGLETGTSLYLQLRDNTSIFLDVLWSD
ncbi:MAG: glucose-6-phosphate isomerase family protein [Candidatus Dojkabacteria bacterium]